MLPLSTLFGRLAVGLCLAIILTGWLSFGTVPETTYNDALFTTDVGLLTSYFLLVYYSANLHILQNEKVHTLLILSGMVFVLYAIWDVIALAGRDTQALATELHLRRFVVICLLFALVFFLLALCGSQQVLPPHFLSILGAACWIVTLTWWHVGRFQAAVKDLRNGKENG